MELKFDDILFSQKGKTGFVVGLGPSLSAYLDAFKKMSQDKEKYSFICCNDFSIKADMNADYWVLASSVDTVKNLHNQINAKPDVKLVYADSVDLTDKEFVKNNVRVDYIAYDQRHFEGETCSIKSCCKYRVPGRLTIQEYLMRISGYDKRYGPGDTVALHMFALSLILGLNPVYLVGVDLDYSRGYVNGGSSSDDFNQYMGRLISDFSIIADSARAMGVKAINLSPFSKLATYMETSVNDAEHNIGTWAGR